ncbi:MAG: heme-binding domain-containing protein, partial [Bryobacteraceae bacterium]|nr:heme-binding domain-containing protein [Bryobacteraceae bacterium]
MKVHLSKPIVITGLVVFVCFVALQALQPTLNNSPVAAEVKVPAEVKRILSKSCYNCHSNQTRLAWFDRIVPGYWLVASHVHAGRKVLNFSTLGAQPGPAQRAALFESVNQVRLGAMPPSSYAWLHGSEKLQPAELATLEEYLRDSTDLAPKPTPDSTGQKAPAVTQVRRAPNGIAFMPDYKTWELIGLTERFDNGTVRAVLGNRTAVEAARKGKVNPWPDGSALAKVAWSQNLVTPTVVEPGNFVQVELMIRDSQKFRKTEGWGWG